MKILNTPHRNIRSSDASTVFPPAWSFLFHTIYSVSISASISQILPFLDRPHSPATFNMIWHEKPYQIRHFSKKDTANLRDSIPKMDVQWHSKNG